MALFDGCLTIATINPPPPAPVNVHPACLHHHMTRTGAGSTFTVTMVTVNQYIYNRSSQITETLINLCKNYNLQGLMGTHAVSCHNLGIHISPWRRWLAFSLNTTPALGIDPEWTCRHVHCADWWATWTSQLLLVQLYMHNWCMLNQYYIITQDWENIEVDMVNRGSKEQVSRYLPGAIDSFWFWYLVRHAPSSSISPR